MTMSSSEPKVAKTDQEWREQLTPEQYEVLRRAGTEAPFTGQYVYNKEAGVRKIATETGAGQWGSSLAFAGAFFGVEILVFSMSSARFQMALPAAAPVKLKRTRAPI